MSDVELGEALDMVPGDSPPRLAVRGAMSATASPDSSAVKSEEWVAPPTS
jgi:hypothetical protein